MCHLKLLFQEVNNSILVQMYFGGFGFFYRTVQVCNVVVIFYFKLVILVCVKKIFLSWFVLQSILAVMMCGNLPGTQLEKLHQSAATCCRALVRNRLCDIAFQLFTQYRLQGAIFSEEGEKGKHFLEPVYQQRKRWLCSTVSDLS